MDIYKSNLWFSDIDKVISFIPELSQLNGKAVLITGPTGLICSALIDVLIRFNENYNGNVIIMAAGRSESAVSARFGKYSKREYFRYIRYDASEPIDTDAKADYIIHAAGNSSPDMIVKEPVETLLANIIGVNELCRYGKEASAKRLLYISSSEVYGKTHSDKPSEESDHGSIEILNSRNSYSIGKCAAENLCLSYYEEYGLDTVIARPGHLYGPTAKKTDQHVSSVWAFSVSKGKDIVMKSDGSQLRSYVYCLDCASALISILIKGAAAQAYNISNPLSIKSIKEIAEILSNAGSVKLRLEQPSQKEHRIFNPMSNSSLDSSKLIALGWKGLFDAETGFNHTIQILREAY